MTKAENPPEIQAQELYDIVLETANYFLKNAKLEIRILQKHQPTYEEVAKIMHRVAQIIFDLSDDFDPMMHQKAIDYVCIMEKMGIAIRNGDQDTLSEQVKLLEMKPGC